MYGEVEVELKDYVDYRSERMQVDHVGISKETLQCKAIQIYEKQHKDDADLDGRKFNASSGWPTLLLAIHFLKTQNCKFGSLSTTHLLE